MIDESSQSPAEPAWGGPSPSAAAAAASATTTTRPRASGGATAGRRGARVHPAQRRAVAPFAPRLKAFGYALYDDAIQNQRVAIAPYLI